ncbi:protein translocase subunit SecE [Striga asiatica]|uniref:Protein translocase subunit SecE n=1 Tax=Striga asiatica TaxID=4170 RepID=A0A5A7P796_STRAF|nr:protein translocase subunit SecE [Striga asiatica]
MAAVSGSILNISGIKSHPIDGTGRTKLPFQIHNHDSYRFSKPQCRIALFSKKFGNHSNQYFHHRFPCTTHILSSGRNYPLDNNNNAHRPSLLNFIRDVMGTLRSLFLFLAEQPSQLKYIEWPSFGSTLKTATLTLVLVAVLIVALSSVDSALSYLLALLLRRKL